MGRHDPQAIVMGSHVVVVGVGGIGCPASWGLAEAGVDHLTLIDPDRVSLSNLPRQVLYGIDDIGRPKVEAASERLAGGPTRIEAIHARLDQDNAADLLGVADVVIDATDGALVKDWLNATCVRLSRPLIHAAGLRSEGRLLDVPAGGQPCLACLFGRLEEDQGRCADLGVWGGVVGAVGFLAAAAALRRLADPGAPSEGYVVLDLEGGRTFTLGAEAAPDCPVCGPSATRDLESLPGVTLDLEGERCPLNLLRARAAVEALDEGDTLEIVLGAEGAESVPDGLRALGHTVLREECLSTGARLLVARGATSNEASLDEDLLVRFARQIVMDGVGVEGQRRLLDGCVSIAGRGDVAETAGVYLAAAGVGGVERVEAERVVATVGERRIQAPDAPPRGPAARAAGALLADTVCRILLDEHAAAPELVLTSEGRIAGKA